MTTNKKDDGVVIWKHIGLHGHSVGTFVCDDRYILWKSAITGRDTNDENDEVVAGGTTRKLPSSSLLHAKWTVFGKSGLLRIKTNHPSKSEYRFDGFPPSDYDTLKSTLQSKYKISLQQYNISSAGTQYGLSSVEEKCLIFRHCILDDMNEEGQEFEPRAQDEMMSIDLAEVSQCVLPGNNRNEIEVQFPESDTVEAGTDQLVSIRMYIPPDLENHDGTADIQTRAERLQQEVMETATIRKTTGDVLVSFEQQKGAFLTPRGRYGIELYDTFMRMRGQKYDYKIRYDDINRLFLLPKPDEVHMAFVIALDKPIRQGQQRYQYLVMQATKESDEVVVHLDEETLKKEYNNELQPVMRGSLSNLIAKTFKVIARKKVFIPGKFANANQQASLNCSVRANEGLLYPLEKQFVFIHKPPIIVRFQEIESVEFQRYYGGGQGSTRNFDLCVNLKQSAVMGASVKDYTFSGIDRADYTGLYSFLSGKKIPIKNLQPSSGGASFMDNDEPTSKTKNPKYNENGDDDDDENEDGSDDEEYDEKAAAEDLEPGSSDDEDDEDALDDDEMGSEIDEDLDSDLEEHRASSNKRKTNKSSSGKPTKKKKENDGDDDDDEDDDDDDDDDSPKKKTKKKTSSISSKKSDKGDDKKKKKKKKDPNAPKGASSAYMIYLNENRERIKKENPDAKVTDITKIGASEWKTLSDKKKYEDMALQDKKRYQEQMKKYKPPAGRDDDDDDDGSDKSPKKKSNDKKTDGKSKGSSSNPVKQSTATSLTSLQIFSNEIRPKLKKKYPDLSGSELGKKISEMFQGLSSDEKEKYEALAKKSKTSSSEKKTATTKKDSDSDDDEEEADDDSDDDDDGDDDDDDDDDD